jgi:hypothetical protein
MLTTQRKQIRPVIPAKAGIQLNKPTGCRIKPGMTARGRAIAAVLTCLRNRLARY